jgi:hypothetical protein
LRNIIKISRSDIRPNTNAPVIIVSGDKLDNIVNLFWSERMIIFIIYALEFAVDDVRNFIVASTRSHRIRNKGVTAQRGREIWWSGFFFSFLLWLGFFLVIMVCCFGPKWRRVALTFSLQVKFEYVTQKIRKNAINISKNVGCGYFF